MPIEGGIEYKKLVKDKQEYRNHLNQMIEKYPEIFPEEREKGYKLYGCVESSRQKLKTRRIRLKAS